MRRVLHRIAAFSVTLALVVCWAAIGGGSAYAQQGQDGTAAPGDWASSINLQNVGNNAATPTITFYNKDGGNPINTFSPSSPIAKNGALSLYVPSSITGLGKGQFSAVVSSVEPFQVSVNTASTNSANPPWTAFAYEGIGSSQAGTTLYYPGLYNNYFGFNSEMVIQNAGDATVTLKVDFYNKAGTKRASVNLGNLNKNASRTFPMSTLRDLANKPLPSGNADGLFGAVVTSTQGNIPLVGIANIWRANGTASYDAAAAGSTVLYAPALYKNYYGFGSALTVQNVHPTQTAHGVVTYSNNTSRNFDLPPFAAQEFYQPGDSALPFGNSAGVFSAKVTLRSPGGSLIGLVSQSVPDNSAGSFASYTTPGTATPAVNISSVMHGYYGYFTAVTVQNTSGAPTNVLITYANGKTRLFSNVGANSTVNILHLDSSKDVLTNGTTTSAVVKSVKANGTDDTAPLVAVIQHNTAAGVNGNNPSHIPSDYLLSVSGSPK